MSDQIPSVPSFQARTDADFREESVDLPVNSDETDTIASRFPVPDENWELRERSRRLREAVEAAGGNRAVSSRSRVAYGTLNGYLADGEMKVGNAIALADATGVRLEWLLTGKGPMREGEPPERAPGPAARHRLPVAFDDRDIANLAWALDFAEGHFGREAEPEARVKGMLSAASEFRKVQRMPPLPPMDIPALADSLRVAEAFDKLPRALGRPSSTRYRITRMLGVYELLEQEDETEGKPAS